MKRQKVISSFILKQQFIELLSLGLHDCGLNIVLGFESNYSARICALRISGEKKIEIFVNLNHVKKVTDVKGCSLNFRIRYCVLYIVEYVRQIAKARKDMPQSYFEGLSFLNAIEMYQAKKKVSVYSPLALRKGKIKRTYCIRPIEINSAINAINQLRLLFLAEMNEEDKRVIKTFADKYLLYASLPEIAYVKAEVPVYSLVESIKRIAEGISKVSDKIREFPILTMASFEQIEQMSTKDLFSCCIQSDNKFMIGAGLRIFAFLQVPYGFEEKTVHDKLVEVMKQYIEYSLIYYKELSESKESLLKDNLYAIKTAMKSINNYLDMYEIDMSNGNIHAIE